MWLLSSESFSCNYCFVSVFAYEAIFKLNGFKMVLNAERAATILTTAELNNNSIRFEMLDKWLWFIIIV